MKIIFILFSITIMIHSSQCDSEKTSAPKMTFEPCYTDRESTVEVEAVKMSCVMQGERIVLIVNDQNERYSVCNHSEFEWDANDQYEISGICYEIKPNERWPGTPFQVTKARKLK